MLLFMRLFTCLFLLIASVFLNTTFADDSISIPILCYHNFNPTTPGLMNLTPQKFETQIKWLKDNGFNIVSLKDAVDYLQGKRDSLPAKSVVVTIDDGWKSAYTYLFPIVRKYNIPVTLFIYPETISKGKNALTWEQLKELQQSGLVEIEGHTYSHPNFKQEKRRLSSENYEKLLINELANSKKILEEKMGIQVAFLAWPFGIYDNELEEAAKKAGYTMAFSIDARTADKSYRPMAQPRFMILDKQSMQHFIAIVNGVKNKPRKMGTK